ncbi:hypothetical protein EV424DRAFT_1546676 [Suillus variegatus]|nr:hypothetical protein EV424DRAFT_1546676 [Suillus variegatus]
MTYVSNDPSYWPQISENIVVNYWIVAAGIVVVYDWVLTLGQEIELIWKQRLSLITVLYFTVHTLYWNTVFCCLSSANYAIGIADRCIGGTNVALFAMFGVIMIARLHAMYQGSRTMLIFLVTIFLAINITCGVIAAIGFNNVVAEEFILSGTYMCYYGIDGDEQLLFSMTWTLSTVWEVIALCFSVWAAVKHFRELRRLGPSTGSTIGDCFKVLIQSHVLYFASYVGVSCFQIVDLSPEISNSHSIGTQILGGATQILLVVQMFVLGPRLVLSVREYHAKLVASSDVETSMRSIVCREHVHVSTSSTV